MKKSAASRPFVIPDHQITDESRWLSRRSVARSLGVIAAASVLGPGCSGVVDAAGRGEARTFPGQPPLPADVLATFPAKRNPRFKPGRPLSPRVNCISVQQLLRAQHRQGESLEAGWQLPDPPMGCEGRGPVPKAQDLGHG